MSRRPSYRLALLLAVGAACSGGGPRPPLSEGERTYRAKCTSCHRAYEPAERTARQWDDVIARMERLKKVRLSDEERASIRAYLAGGPRAPGAR